MSKQEVLFPALQRCRAEKIDLEAKLEATEQELQEWQQEVIYAINDERHSKDERNGIRMALAAFHRRFPAAQEKEDG